MIELVPSISVIKGKCVRLKQGNYNDAVVYDESIIDIAKRFEDHGIKKLHLIDLEGAKKGSVVNYDSLGLITGYTDLHVNFGGGVNTDGDMSKVYEHGATSVTVGSLAIKNKRLFSSWIMSYGREKVALSLAVLNKIIQIRGWQKTTDLPMMEIVDYYYQRGIKYIKITDVSRDGLMSGPSFELYQEVLKQYSDLKLYASGGISTVDDIKKLQDIGIHGVLFGKAYYEGKIKLKELSQFLGQAQS